MVSTTATSLLLAIMSSITPSMGICVADAWSQVRFKKYKSDQWFTNSSILPIMQYTTITLGANPIILNFDPYSLKLLCSCETLLAQTQFSTNLVKLWSCARHREENKHGFTSKIVIAFYCNTSISHKFLCYTLGILCCNQSFPFNPRP